MARADRLLGARLKYVDHPSFAEPTFQAASIDSQIDRNRDNPSRYVSTTLRLARFPDRDTTSPILSREEEARMFRQMNYLKSRASRLQEQVDRQQPSAADLDEIERLQSEALAMKHSIVEKNIPLVVFIVKKRIRHGQDLSELVSDGSLALIQAVDSFDFARGNRFSTYATWAIRNAVASRTENDRRHRGRSIAPYEATLVSTEPGAAEFENEQVQANRRSTVRRWFARLGKREQWILANRYGLGGFPERTLAHIGRELGISKQRVSQVAKRAENKLRKIARHETLEALEI
jgi:RNA polymerase primary sigma factor